MEQPALNIAGTASYTSLNANHSSVPEADTKFEITDILGNYGDVSSNILPNNKYRVMAGRLYIIDPGAPPKPSP